MSATVVVLACLLAYFGLGRYVLSLVELRNPAARSRGNVADLVWSVSWPIWMYIGNRRRGRK